MSSGPFFCASWAQIGPTTEAFLTSREERRFYTLFRTLPACFDIETAVGEACANAVEHGYTRTRGFSIACGFADGALTVEIRDFHGGAPLSPASKASRMGLGKNEGGLGLLLISALTDEWHLRPANSGGSILTFRVGHERTPASASPVQASSSYS